jgi:hypothetical protein
MIMILPVIIAIGIAVWLDYARKHMPDVEAEARIRAAGGSTQRDDALPFWLPPRDTTWDELGHVWVVRYYGPVTEPMLADVAALSRLESLTLMNAHVAKDGLPHLAKLHHLRELTLISTDLTDADLIHLHGLNSLRHTYLVNNPGLTLGGIKELQRKLPRLYIAYYARDHTVGVAPDYSSDQKP